MMSDEEEEITVKIQCLETNSSKCPPIVGYFPSGYDPLKKKTSAPSVKVYKNAERSNRFQVKVTPNNGSSNVQFVGNNIDGEGSRPQLCSYALAVFDKSTNLIKMVPIAANKIFRMEPKVGGQEEEVEDEQPKNDLTKEEKAEAMKDLQIQYSTRKAEREHKKRDALHAHEDDETRQDLDNKIEAISMPEEAQEVAGSSINGRNVPPYDLEASDPSRAYPLEKIIYKGEWEYLLDVFNISQGEGEVKPEVYPIFVCNRVHKLDRLKDENEKRKLAGLLSFITHLINFKNKCSMDGVRSAAHHKIPGIFFQKFSSMFSDPESKLLSIEKIELLIGYVLVLTLYVDDFRTDVADISKDLKMSSVKLRTYYETLGCKLFREKQLLLATLQVPLKFPQTTRKKRRRNN